MLRAQLLLASISIAAAYGLAAVASFQMLDHFGLPAVAALAATCVIAVSRAMELFIDDTKPHPQPLLPWVLGTWQWLALTGWLLSAMPEAANALHLLQMPVSPLIAALAALVLELGQRLAVRLIGPSLQQALHADLAVSEWFARRRIDVERELLAELSRDAANDVRFTRRLETLRRRFDRAFPTLS